MWWRLGEIFLLSDSSELHSCQYSGNLSGILVAVDAKAAKESLMTACSALGMELNTKVVQRKMAASRGCMALHGTPWTQAFFETVRQLSEEAQERYCVFKSVELLYLLCTEAEEADGAPPVQAAQYPTTCWKSRHTSRHTCLKNSPLTCSASSFPFPQPS